jgi:hypothetical protein
MQASLDASGLPNGFRHVGLQEVGALWGNHEHGVNRPGYFLLSSFFFLAIFFSSSQQ